METLSKLEVSALIDKHFHSDLEDKIYTVHNKKAMNLLTSNRLDLAFKLLYLELKDKDVNFSREWYTEHIRAFTLGEFTEPGNENKNTIDKFIEVFNDVFNDISKHGFDSSKTLIPLSKNNSISNGAHRVASAIFLEKEVACVSLNSYDDQYDYDFFYKRGVSKDILEAAVSTFIEYASNVHIAFIWPTAVKQDDRIDEIIPNIIYKKEMKLNANGAHNLLSQLYYGEEWLGGVENNFKGTKGKLLECFKTFDPVRVIAFQADSLAEVLEVKEKIREVFNVGKHSIHITDTKEEAIQAARMAFNDNAIHFLNYAKPNSYASTHQKIDDFKSFIKKNSLDERKLLLDSSILLSLYGLREAKDTDYFCNDNSKIQLEFNDINMHDEELKYYGEGKHEMIYNPKFHFYFNDVKFIAFSKLYEMKTNRNEEKDQNDCKMMEALLEDNRVKVLMAQFKQNIYYKQMKARQKSVYFLQKIGLFEIARRVYRKVKGVDA